MWLFRSTRRSTKEGRLQVVAGRRSATRSAHRHGRLRRAPMDLSATNLQTLTLTPLASSDRRDHLRALRAASFERRWRVEFPLWINCPNRTNASHSVSRTSNVLLCRAAGRAATDSLATADLVRGRHLGVGHRESGAANQVVVGGFDCGRTDEPMGRAERWAQCGRANSRTSCVGRSLVF